MELRELHSGILPRAEYGIRANRLSQAAAAGANVPPGLVIPDASQLDAPEHDMRDAIADYLQKGQLYALRASPGRADWGGPYTFLALGMNDDVFRDMRKKDDPLTAIELYRQALVTYGIAAEGIDAEPFEALISQFGGYDPAGSEGRAMQLLEASRKLYREEVGKDFPSDPLEQLMGAVHSMARQWQAPTARILRGAKGAPDDAHLALILQTMVHGLGRKNGAGRVQGVDADTGERDINGFFVKSTLSAASASPSQRWTIRSRSQTPNLEKFDPQAFATLCELLPKIAKEMREPPELKFVIEDGQVYITEILVARRKTGSSLRVLHTLVEDQTISREEALIRIDPASIAGALHPSIDPEAPREVLSQGIAASPGAASGRIVFSAERALAAQAQGLPVILVRQDTGPEDIRGMHAAAGVLTQRGGITSHAAVIARGIGVPCVVGVQDFRFNSKEDTILFPNGVELRESDIITIDGNSGEVLAGEPKMIEASPGEDIHHVLEWANDIRRMGVRVNADTPQDAERAIRFGVQGIGLCRTEHMFFAEDRLVSMRKTILADDAKERAHFLAKLETAQREDFIELFEIMKGLPVTIRLLDPPLHEFLPNPNHQLTSIAESLDLEPAALRSRIRELYEVNPMLGMRGVRLGILMPEIYEMQARAIFMAAAEVNKTAKEPVVPEVMIPLVSAVREVELVKSRIDKLAQSVAEETKADVPYRLGVMVETPRAALRAADLASVSDFLSMGTNDLTQMTYGLSRDDAGRFMREYVNMEVFHEDPFLTLDVDGVGELVLEAAKRGRAANPEIILGLCGEHGGDPNSIHFCEVQRFDYVSCSPFRVPIAQIAAAQAYILLNS